MSQDKWRPWTIRQARRLVNELEARLAGWYVALAGSVLLRGESSNDLDLIFYPHTSTKIWRPFADSLMYDLKIDELYRVLRECGLTQLASADRVKEVWAAGRSAKRGPSDDQKWVEIWMYDEQRVDVFVMR